VSSLDLSANFNFTDCLDRPADPDPILPTANPRKSAVKDPKNHAERNDNDKANDAKDVTKKTEAALPVAKGVHGVMTLLVYEAIRGDFVP